MVVNEPPDRVVDSPGPGGWVPDQRGRPAPTELVHPAPVGVGPRTTRWLSAVQSVRPCVKSPLGNVKVFCAEPPAPRCHHSAGRYHWCPPAGYRDLISGAGSAGSSRSVSGGTARADVDACGAYSAGAAISAQAAVADCWHRHRRRRAAADTVCWRSWPCVTTVTTGGGLTPAEPAAPAAPPVPPVLAAPGATGSRGPGVPAGTAITTIRGPGVAGGTITTVTTDPGITAGASRPTVAVDTGGPGAAGSPAVAAVTAAGPSCSVAASAAVGAVSTAMVASAPSALSPPLPL